MRLRARLCTFFVLLLVAAVAAASDVHFESPPVHPLELSPDGDTLFAVHTADHRLVVYDLTLVGGNPTPVAEIQVGLEPVSVRARTNDEVWVVNHISDSISIVKISTGNVVATLNVGDEPTDVVFAGNPQRAFVVLSQEDMVRVYDPANLTAAPNDIPLETSDPRSATVSADGTKVFVTGLEASNQTTIIPAAVVDGEGGPAPPDPPLKQGLPDPPSTGVIVRWDGAAWRDDANQDWSAFVSYSMPDNDVLAIDVASETVTQTFSNVGTSIFNVAPHPTDPNLVYVTNQEAFNEIRFEPNLKGKFTQSQISILDPSGSTVMAVHLNDHIDYNDEQGTPTERAQSLAMPLDAVVATTGEVYVAAFSSSKVGVLDAAGNVTRRIDVGGGPAGLALDEGRNRLHVLNRFDSSLTTVDLSDDSSTTRALGYDPTPTNVKTGREFLYDAQDLSAHGDQSCGGCHIFANFDNLAWDLGDPQGDMSPAPPQNPPLPDFHPMKGVMTTQSLRGLPDTDPLHWRGDRVDFEAFNGAFVSLMGRGTEISSGDMALYREFIESIAYPPNPFRDLDGTLPTSLNDGNPQNGENLFLTGNLVGSLDCVDCHSLGTGENGVLIPGQLLLEPEAKVVPQLRNMYEKTGLDSDASVNVRGFGFTHDGAIDDLFTFLDFPGFNFNNDQDQRDVASFLLAWDTETPNGVGAQWTMDGTNEAQGLARVNKLVSLADVNTIGLVAKGRVAGQPRGWVYSGGGVWTSDKQAEGTSDLTTLLGLAGFGTEVTFTGVVEGCEWRLGVDRDEDGFRDGDELDGGSNPGDPTSVPGATGIDDPVVVAGPGLRLLSGNPASGRALLAFETPRTGSLEIAIFDVRGRLVRTLLPAGHHPSGVFDLAWDLRDDRRQAVPSGVYYVRLQSSVGVRTQPVTVVR